MNEEIILELEKHNIYLLSDNNIAFYISIPKENLYDSINISIDLNDNYKKLDSRNNDMVYIKDNLADIYNNIDNENITLITPIFYNDILNMLKGEQNEKLYIYLDKCISYIINNAYKSLTNKKIKVNSKVIIVNNEKFSNFITWFSEKYTNRIESKSYTDLIGELTSVIPVLNTKDISDIQSLYNQKKEEEIPKNSGFISYILLGSLALVLTLVILYLLL